MSNHNIGDLVMTKNPNNNQEIIGMIKSIYKRDGQTRIRYIVEWCDTTEYYKNDFQCVDSDIVIYKRRLNEYINNKSSSR